MALGRDWHAWHSDYDDPGSALARRLRLVQGHIDEWLDRCPDGPLNVVSACAGQGRDLLEVLARRPDADRVRGRLLESDARNTAAARAAIAEYGLAGMTVVEADAGDATAYGPSVPADLVLMAGVFGNISDDDIQRTVAALPGLCAPDATVIWTRSRRHPDLTPALRQWFAAAGFAELAFDAPDDVLFTVGVHRYAGGAQPPVTGRLFSFPAFRAGRPPRSTGRAGT